MGDYYTDSNIGNRIGSLAVQLKMRPYDLEFIIHHLEENDEGDVKTLLWALGTSLNFSDPLLNMGIAFAIKHRLSPVAQFCGECGGECLSKEVDEGVGGIDVAGATENHHDYQVVSSCCEGTIYSDSNLTDIA